MINYLVQMQPEQRRKVKVISAISIILFAIIWLTVIRTPAYAVYVNGHKSFYIKNAQCFENAIENIREDQIAQYNRVLDINGEVDIKRVFVSRSVLVPADKVAQVMNNILNFKMLATGIVVDGQQVVYVENEEVANDILEKLKTQYSQVENGEKLISVQFNEEVELLNKEIPAGQMVPQDEAYKLITIGTTSPEEYLVVEGDSLWLIARRNDMYVNDIVQANNLTTDFLSLGQKLILTKTKPYINVAAVVAGDRTVDIPYEVKVVTDNSISSSSVRVKQEGAMGEKHVVYREVKVNGQVESRLVEQETILKQAVDKIMVKGGQVQVASRGASSSSRAVVASGSLSWPVYGTITQYYRGGHSALDIATSAGTPIKAADNGYVTYAAYQGGYGNFVIVDHGNGIVTRYAHCQSIRTSVGQNVKKGEVIATLGSTGRSTGPHLHFEVLSGGAFVNPLNALN